MSKDVRTGTHFTLKKQMKTDLFNSSSSAHFWHKNCEGFYRLYCVVPPGLQWPSQNLRTPEPGQGKTVARRNIEQHLSGFHHNPPEKYPITKMTYLIGNRQQHMKEDWKIVLVLHSSLCTIITTNLEFGFYTRTKMLDYVRYLLYSTAHLCWTRLPSLCQHCHSLTLEGWARISDARSGARRSRAHCGKQRCSQYKIKSQKITSVSPLHEKRLTLDHFQNSTVPLDHDGYPSQLSTP